MTESKPKRLRELFLECHDAKVFREKQNHEVLAHIFFRDPRFERALRRNVYFIIGEKGAGKTMVAQYLSIVSAEVDASIVDFSTIDFEYFHKLIDEEFIRITPASKVWQVLVSSLLSNHLINAETNIFGDPRFASLRPLIDEVPKSALVPEFPISLQVLAKLRAGGEVGDGLLSKLNWDAEGQVRSDSQEIRTPVHALSQRFEQAFSQIRTKKKHIIFVDGIDVKPAELSQEKFVHHLRAFVRSVLHLNENVLSQIKGGGFVKIVLLLRPDIFNQMGLQNQGAKVSDNSLVLSWESSTQQFKQFDLYRLSRDFLGRQSPKGSISGDAWDYYVSPDVYGGRVREHENLSFLEFLRYSWYRPRDIIRVLRMCQEKAVASENVIDRSLFERARQNFSGYLLSEVRDYWRFYFPDEDFALVQRFFMELRSEPDFTYLAFLNAHQVLMRKLESEGGRQMPDSLRAPDTLLQMLYSSNMICWQEESEYSKIEQHWAFRERSANQADPLVAPASEYRVHWGLLKDLNLPRRFGTAVG